jgi:hypothetical protein
MAKRGIAFDSFRQDVEQEVRYANITIIEGIGASQYGVGMVAAASPRSCCAASALFSPSAPIMRATMSPWRCRAW